MLTRDDYEDLIRLKLRELARANGSTLELARVVEVLAPLEATCFRPRCFESDICVHLRVDALALGTTASDKTERPFTASFQQGENPDDPVISQGWL